jgi:hypothetical protein
MKGNYPKWLIIVIVLGAIFLMWTNNFDISKIGFMDKIPPIISDVTVIDITGDSAVVTWSTNEKADSKVYYKRADFDGPYQSESNSYQEVKHSMGLKNLDAGTEYSFYVQSEDEQHNLSAQSRILTFRTNST